MLQSKKQSTDSVNIFKSETYKDKPVEHRGSKLKIPEEDKTKKSIDVESKQLKSLIHNLMENFLQGRRNSDIAGKDDIVDINELRRYSRRASVAVKNNELEFRRLFARKMSDYETHEDKRKSMRLNTVKDEKRNSYQNDNNQIMRFMSKFEINNLNIRDTEIEDNELTLKRKKTIFQYLTKQSPKIAPQPVLNTQEIFSLHKDQLLQKINEKKLHHKKTLFNKIKTQQDFHELDNSSINDFVLEDESANKTIKFENDVDKRILKKTKRVDDSMSSQDDEELDQLKESTVYIDLESPFKRYWDIIIILCTLYTLIAAPYMLAFVDDEPYLLIILECIIDIIFILDIMVQFFIPYINKEEEVVKNLKAIAKNYILSWFIIDLLASVPGSTIVLIIDAANGGESVNRFSAINKAARLVRVYRFFKFSKIAKALKVSSGYYGKHNPLESLEKFSEITSAKKKRLTHFIISFILVSHIITCFWVFIGKSSNPTWVTFAKLSDADDGMLYISSLYFHWTTIFTIGYGDIICINSDERLYNCLLLFIGVFIYSYTVSQLGNILSSKDIITSKHLKNVEVLDGLKKKYNIPDSFYNKIFRYLNYNYKFNKNERYGFINELPTKIRISLLYDMYKEVIENFSFFSYTDNTDFIARALFTMKPLRIYKKEFVVMEGQYLDEVLFVRKGYLTVHLSAKYNEYRLMDVKRNEHFGDILTLSNQRSPISIKAGSKVVDLLIINKEDFLELSKEFPEALEDIFLVSSYNFSSLLEIIEVKKMQIQETNKIKETIDVNRKKSDLARRFSHLFKDESSVPFFNPNINNTNPFQEDTTVTHQNNQEFEASTATKGLYSQKSKEINKRDSHILLIDKKSTTSIPDIKLFTQSPVKSDQFDRKKSEYSYSSISHANSVIPNMNMFNFNLYIQNNSFIQKPSFNSEDKDKDIKLQNDPRYVQSFDDKDINIQSENNPKEEIENDEIVDSPNEEVKETYTRNKSRKGTNTAPVKKTHVTDSSQEDDQEEEYDKFDANKNDEHAYKAFTTKLSKVDLPNRRESFMFKPFKKLDMLINDRVNKPMRFLTIKHKPRNTSSREVPTVQDSIKRNSAKNLANLSKKLQHVSKEKFRRSSILMNNITNNLKQNEQVESNPHEFFVNEFKELLYNQLENEVAEQEKKVISIFMKIYNKKEVDKGE
jgi:hypothetical protein